MIWIALIDKVPSLSTEPHEICEPEAISEGEIVRMWDALKSKYEQAQQVLEEIRMLAIYGCGSKTKGARGVQFSSIIEKVNSINGSLKLEGDEP